MRGRLAGALLVAAPALASAQAETEVEAQARPAPNIEVQLFGGVVGFPGEAAVDPGAAYGVSVGLRPGSLLGVELGYQGGAYTESVPGEAERVAALENGAYGLLKLQPEAGPVEPYLFSGIGVARINAVDEPIEDGVLRDDTFAKVPVGGGVDIRVETFSVGVRGLYGFVFGNRDALQTDSARGGDQLLGTVHLGAQF
ncbi:hypothetical protein [Vulgatibacter sp.]|uniref:hypothetical protein n=1 Tax=Vulgatibacter sp. TaxID=1971226 RepID=UPI003563F09D